MYELNSTIDLLNRDENVEVKEFIQNFDEPGKGFLYTSHPMMVKVYDLIPMRNDDNGYIHSLFLTNLKNWFNTRSEF